jgi:hypothetical protein
VGKDGFLDCQDEDPSVPGRHVTDQQVRLYMEFRRHHSQRLAAAKAGLSERTARRIERDPRLPSQKAVAPGRQRRTPDPLEEVWQADILPLLEGSPGLRPITLLEEMQRRHPDRDWGFRLPTIWLHQVCSKHHVHEARPASPHHDVAGWSVMRPCEIAAEAGDFHEVVR